MANETDSFKQYLVDKDNKEDRKRTININESIHAFYKTAAAHYDVNISTIVNNVLQDWIDEHHLEIKQDILKKVKNIRIYDPKPNNK